jgi:uncharacterized membrane protein/YHS domain-containing protein
MSAFETLIALLGRAHPMVLHLPIGLVAALVILEAVRWVHRERERSAAIVPLAWCNALTAAIAVASGLALAEEPGYGGTTLDRHKLLGIAFAVLSVALAALATKAARRQHGPKARGAGLAYTIALLVTMVGLVPVGHLGAEMTHGAGFLTEPLRARAATNDDVTPTIAQAAANDVAPDATAADGARALPASVRAILTSRCTACHGESRTKGLLALHTLAAIEAGGEHGSAIVWGKPEESLLLTRMLLPLDDDDHMPPEGKPQPDASEIETIRSWILAGADASALAASAPQEAPAVVPAADVPPTPDSAAVARLRDALVHVQPVANDSPLLWVDFSAVRTADDALVRSLLEPLGASIADLNLAGTAIGDGTLTLTAAMKRLRRLDVRDTAITDQGFAAMKDHASLRELIIVGTKLTDSSTETLRSLAGLERLFAWRSGIGGDALVALRADRPNLRVDADEGATSEPIETEPVLTFTSDAPIPGAPASAAATPPIVAINAVCPVSGAPVNPTYTIVWEGRPIGFCCEKCAASFWANPASFTAAIRPK